MKKLISMVAVLFLVSQISVFANEIKTVSFEETKCQSINFNSEITLCLDLADQAIGRRTKRILKQSLNQLIQSQNNEKANSSYNLSSSSCTYYDWDPEICDPGKERDYCDVYPSDPLCEPEEPDPPSSTCTYYDWDPDQCDGTGQGRDYCEVYPNDPHCEEF